MKNITPENRGVAPEIFERILEKYNRSSAIRSMGFKLLYLGQGRAGLQLSVNEDFLNTLGTLHGGIITAMADTSMGYALQTLGGIAVTLELNINYFAPITAGMVITSEGWVVNAGKSIIVTEAALFNEQGVILCKSRATFFAKPD